MTSPGWVMHRIVHSPRRAICKMNSMSDSDLAMTAPSKLQGSPFLHDPAPDFQRFLEIADEGGRKVPEVGNNSNNLACHVWHLF